MKKLLLLAILAGLLAGGPSADAAERTEPAAEPWEAPQAAMVVLAATNPTPTRGPSTFAMGMATLLGAGFLHWRRKRYLALTAAL